MKKKNSFSCAGIISNSPSKNSVQRKSTMNISNIKMGINAFRQGLSIGKNLNLTKNISSSNNINSELEKNFEITEFNFDNNNNNRKATNTNLEPQKLKKVLFRKPTKIKQTKNMSDINISNKPTNPLKKRESTIENLIYQRSLLGTSINAAKDPQSILIINKRISRLNVKIQDLLNENSKKMMKEQWGFASSDDNRKITEVASSTSRFETNRIVSLNDKKNIPNSKKKKENRDKNDSMKNKNGNNDNNDQYKYLSLLRDQFLKNDDILNMNGEILDIYNMNKKHDKLSKLQNQLKMNMLKKMINAKTFVEKTEDSHESNIFFIRKKDLRSNVYKPSFNHKTNYESLNQKSLRLKGFKNGSKSIMDNFVDLGTSYKGKSKNLERESSYKNNYKNDENDIFTTHDIDELDFNQINYQKSSIKNTIFTNLNRGISSTSFKNSRDLMSNSNKDIVENKESYKSFNVQLNNNEFKASPVRNLKLSRLFSTRNEEEKKLIQKKNNLSIKNKFVEDVKRKLRKKNKIQMNKLEEINLNDYLMSLNENLGRNHMNKTFSDLKKRSTNEFNSEDKPNQCNRVLSADPLLRTGRFVAYSNKIDDKSKEKENIFKGKLTHLRKIFGVAYKESQRLDNRDTVTNLEMGNKKLEKTVKEKHVLNNVNNAEIIEDNYLIKKYFDKNDLFNSSSDNELNEDFIDRHKEILKTCKDDKVRSHLVSAFTKIEIEDRILHRNKYKYNLEERFKSLEEKKEYKKLANQKMAIEKELKKDVFDVNDYLENRLLVNEIINMDQSNPMEVLQWNAKKVKIMKDIKPNIILQFNKKKKNRVMEKL